VEAQSQVREIGELHRNSGVGVPRSVISAKVRLALRCKSMFSENTRVLKA
jgi:hypothetical protein